MGGEGPSARPHRQHSQNCATSQDVLLLYFPVEPDELLVVQFVVVVTIVGLDQLACLFLAESQFILQNTTFVSLSGSYIPEELLTCRHTDGTIGCLSCVNVFEVLVFSASTRLSMWETTFLTPRVGADLTAIM